MPEKPNILWLCSDQQRYDALGVMGNSHINTPNLDRLASEGVLFTNTFCQNPMCTPSRAAMLTGRYPRTTRVRQNGQSIPADEVLVTKLIADAGWDCGLVGKLHLSSCEGKEMERRVDDGYGTFHWSHGNLHPSPSNGYRIWLEEQGVDWEWTLKDQGKDPGTYEHWCYPGPPAELHHTTWCAEKAIEFITEDRDDPWLLSVNFFDPHAPFDPPPEYLEKYDPDELPDPVFDPEELDRLPSQRRRAHLGEEGVDRKYGVPFADLSPKQRRSITASYYAMVELIDVQVGRILDSLDKTGQADNTIVIFTSDHGEMLGDHGIYLKGPHFYDPAVRVPLMVRWSAGFSGDRSSSALVELFDLAPTLLDAAGLGYPPGMQAKSLMPLLKGEIPPDQHKPHVYCEFYNTTPRFKDPAAYATMYRDTRYKVVVWHDQELGEFYDLQEDPQEQRNLWNSSAHESLCAELIKKCFDASVFTIDPLPEREGMF